MKHLTNIELKQKYMGRNPSDVVDVLGFEKSIEVAYAMLLDKEWDETLQLYATALMEEIRKKNPESWNSSWKYDAFLGYGYHILLDYDNRYFALKRAFDKANPKPPQLLIALSDCYLSPGKPHISTDEALTLIKEAIKTTPYIEGFKKLLSLYKFLGDIKEQKHCEEILEKIKDSGVHLTSLDEVLNID